MTIDIEPPASQTPESTLRSLNRGAIVIDRVPYVNAMGKDAYSEPILYWEVAQ